jgi:hypothetical protein
MIYGVIMKSTIQKICQLQPFYSSENTPDMQERGALIRQELPSELRSRLELFKNQFDDIFDDLAVEASDGSGRKTEAPWVRICSKAMSPKPTEGYYLVLHFCADGTAFYITVGCGSTIWNGSHFRPIPDLELEKRTTWAREIIAAKWGDLGSFGKEMTLGANAPLTKTFEKATVMARKIAISDIHSADLEQIIKQASSALNDIYVAQIEGRDVSPGEQDVSALNKIVRPLGKPSRGQGRGLNAKDRKAVELQAMAVATNYFVSLGYSCEDTSANNPFDILVSKDGLSIKVEVKGTTSDFSDSILMTKNEVKLHQEEKGRTTLAVVSKIRLNRNESPPAATEGEIEVIENWDIDSWKLEPIAFQVSRRQ